MGRGFMAMMSAMAEDERLRIIKRTHEGRKIARAKGVRMGRKPKLTPHQKTEARQRIAKGESTRDLAKSYGVSVSTISRTHVMSTLQELIRTATRQNSSISDVLRQCLVLAYELDNEALKAWLDGELNGYNNWDDVPNYRRINITAKGFFVGAFGSSINDQPLASHILDKEHRHWAEENRLMQPIAAYEEFTRERTKRSPSARVNWPASLTTRYQTKFFEDFVLNRAWHENTEQRVLWRR